MAKIVTTADRSATRTPQPNTGSNIVTSSSITQQALAAQPQPPATSPAPAVSPPAKPIDLSGPGVTGLLPLSRLSGVGAKEGDTLLFDGTQWTPGGSTTAWQYGTGSAPVLTVPSSAAPQGAWFYNVISAGLIDLPTSPTDGQSLYVVDEDGTAVNQGITIDGKGKNIIALDGTSAGSYVFSTAAHGYAGGAVTRLLYSASRNAWKVIK